MKITFCKKVISIVLVILLSFSIFYLPGTSLKTSAACAGGCSFTAQKIGAKYLKSESTCGKQAEYYYSCAVCGMSSAETNEAKTFTYGTAPDHNWGPAQTVPATCTEPEMKVQTCSRCGQKYAKKGSGTALGHSEKVISNGDGTHTTICANSCGFNEVADCATEVLQCGVIPTCDICKAPYGKTEGHELTVAEIKKQPTCTEKGEALKKCAHCDYTETEEIDALGHDKKITTAIAPTCVYEGYHVYKCARCGIEDRETVAPLGHFYPSEWTVIITPDCQTRGAKIKICANCNNIISENIPKTGHVDYDGDSKCDTCDKTIITIEPETPEEKPCNCDCHAGGIKAFFFKLFNFFAKIFDKSARVCDCGKAH